MKFGLLYELQLPRPWDNRAEHRMIHEALAEVVIADQLGFDCVWANEHHFLEEYSHSSAPEVFLAAAAQIPVIEAYGSSVVASQAVTEKPTYRIGAAGGFEVPMEDPAMGNLYPARE